MSRLLIDALINLISVYDAADLELALRRGAVLASLDGPLHSAAKKVGLPILPKKLPDAS
jgi:predicted nucleic acid-binding protein